MENWIVKQENFNETVDYNLLRILVVLPIHVHNSLKIDKMKILKNHHVYLIDITVESIKS